MRLLLTGRNVDITPPLRQQVTRQLAKLERVLQDSAMSAQVVLSRERHRHLTDIALHARGDNVLAGVGTATTWPLSIKDAVEKIELQAKRVKGKWTTRKRRAMGPRQVAATIGEGAPAPAAEQPPDVPKVVRTRYSIRAMSLDEAAERFTTGDEPFVLFRDRVAGKVMMVFRRKDGQLGFLEPQA